MIDTTLILIDGLTGSGKSTTAQRLWLHLERCGVAARWIYEHDTSHPIWEAGELQCIFESGAVAPGFATRTLPMRWRRLALHCAASGVRTILESALLQSTVGLLLAMNADEREITSSILACDHAVAGQRPVLVWFRPGDVAQALRAVCDDRCDSGYEAALIKLLAATPYGRDHGLADFAGLVRFYQRWSDLAESLCARLGMPVLALDAPGWPARERRIAEFLGLPPFDEPRVRIEAPSRFLGPFRDMGSDDRLVIAGGEDGLHLDDARHTRLIAHAGATFHIAALCAELSFEDERGGRFHRIGLRGNLPGLSPTWYRVEGEEEVRP
ncbi:hypothetical protein [Variovorax sp. J22R115]|uniref:hypothetical protein n=1 Tax=Variovorax sp. J22R115 TaxID=3053509 RepID=UPI00257764AE|nr:hypothetical protein [Variovorax sp. J22R115]MDM0053602.1 hypothetical protein [Variovorax sp. J22R115]